MVVFVIDTAAVQRVVSAGVHFAARIVGRVIIRFRIEVDGVESGRCGSFEYLYDVDQLAVLRIVVNYDAHLDGGGKSRC